MSMLKLFVCFELVIFAVNGFAQHSSFNSQSNWSLNKRELQFGLGGTQFTGDLGGTPNIGKDYSLRDINLKSTGFAAWLGYRYRFHPFFATTSSLCLFRLKGDDKLSENPIRNSRNLNFRSTTFEVQQRLECIFYSVERFGARYRLPGTPYQKNRSEQYYFFSGIGLMKFNPKGYWNGEWYELTPLRTEGQGLKGGPAPYKRYTLTIPFGIGFRVGINRMWRIGIEATYVKTFSDYIDDVSSVYYDPNKYQSGLAAHFSNPATQNLDWFRPGDQRGDPEHKDAYYHLNFILTRNITYKEIRMNGRRQKIFKNRSRLGRFRG
jgi:hypothetical protein